jgi:hypothetical protein
MELQLRDRCESDEWIMEVNGLDDGESDVRDQQDVLYPIP